MDVSVLSRVDSLSPLLFSRIQSGLAAEKQRDDSPRVVSPTADPATPDTRDESKRDRTRSYATHMECALRNFGKGAALGVGGRTAFALLGTLMRSGRHERPMRAAFVSKEHAQWAAFLGSFLALHNTMLRCHPPAIPRDFSYRQMMAGTLAGFSLRLAPSYARPYLALLLSVRAMEVAGRSAAQKGIMPEVLATNADIKLMMACSAVVMTAWIFEPQLLEPAYLRFLNKQSGKDTRLLRAIAASFDGDLHSRPGVLPALNALRAESSLPPLDLAPSCGNLHCNVLHLPVQNCTEHLGFYFASGWLRAATLYAPVHLLPLVLLRPSALISKPIGVTTQAALKITRSALFLSSYCTTGFAVLCFCARAAEKAGTKPKRWHATALSSVCGLALYFEKPGRRLELALYTLLQAMRCCPHPQAKEAMRKHLSVPAFAIAAGIVSHHYARHPASLRPSYRSILGRFLDATGGDNHRRLLS